MNKIVCDICGTSYPETASQCPICGNAKSENAVTPADSVSQESGYAYVKGGRFSHSNVRKRNNGQKDLPRTVAPAKPVKEKPAPQEQKEKPVPPVFVQPEPVQEEKPEPKSEPMQEDPVPVAPSPVNPRRRDRKQQKKKERSGNIALVIIVVILLIAIIGVCVYIGYSWMELNSRPTVPSGTNSQSEPTHSTSSNLPVRIPCTGINLTLASIEFTSVTTRMLDFKVLPKDCTDVVSFESSDPYIATVNSEGVISTIAKGTVTITIRCGEQVAYCEIICKLPNEPTYPTDPTDPTTPTTKPTEPSQPPLLDVKLEINRSEFTLTGNGSYHDLYKKSSLDPTMIKWSSDDESVVQVTNKGRVIAVGNGQTWVYAQYGDQKVKCKVYVNGVIISDYEIRTQVVPDRISTDITIKVGDTIKFYLVNKKTGERVDVTELVFKSSHPNFFTIDEDGVVTAIKSNEGYNPQYVMIEYEGKTYKCQLRVKK